VNDWGQTTAREVIEGTRAFLEAHPYVDPRRVGAIGASYGGFLTMTLVTETDLYAAAVAHAGISSLASYWGEGYWGYAYSAVATAESFPWNRPDLYVERSPLFRADRVKTPILLTHGRSDTNVPVGESDQFFVALKLLGAPVEYVQVEGEDHWILTHDKRHVWSKTILAWFDRWLRDEPGWWSSLHPD
jgi:dipeptidyl aminopeptidase/acylaminoacyl peptidase